MKAALAMWLVAVVALPAGAQAPDPHAGHQQQPQAADPHSGHEVHAPPANSRSGQAENPPPAEPPARPPPAAAFSGPRHAADRLYGPAAMAAARERLRAEHGAMKSWAVTFDRLEMPIGDAGDEFAWEAQAWYGGDVDKLRIKTEGEDRFGDGGGEAEVQALWSHAITPWFDVGAGVRYDWRPEPERGYLVLGMQGVTPYWLEIEAAAFLSEDGDLSARFEAEYDVLVTPRLVLQPRAELELASQEIPELGIGDGFNGVELGLRLRYQVAPELAPYAGLQWERKLGRSADFARLGGESTSDFFMVAGVRFWF